ncbi:mechanosensitive ion channel family protein [Pelovirga terrestris]|uniref:Mechanosensitive ion channel n=1 Tax=Pelovirga terrestris TaxID=2771352 RepID=A0A8J6R660_9BACT|nr:mechanosensitive ion channel domain-containing protein [Pelovirga terrestris]MBD1401034.1 mechanosensitive ion channel [Pelovirga terrestris]
MDNLKIILLWLWDILQWPMIETADTRITAWAILSFVVLVVGLLWFARKTQRWLAEGPLLRVRMSESARYSIGALVRYLILLIGLLIILQTVGIDLTTFNVLAGAIGIGVGFGLQNIVSNFIAGLIIMFERPVKMGDRIVVGGVEGNVVNIGARSTTVLDNDNIAVIVPNSKFITDDIVNWKYNNNEVRFRIPVSVAYGSDARQVEKLLLEIADQEDDVLKLPPPAVRFLEFGDNGLLFELRAWSSSLVDRKGKLISQLNFAIYERFNQEGIAFPFPQRDIHLRSGVLEVRRADSANPPESVSD